METQMFGTYKVIKPIGTGGFAQVYLVEDNLERLWVLKKFHQDIQQDSGFPKRFEREARIQAKLSHSNIAQAHVFNSQEGYLVMDYIDGKTLQNLLDNDYPDGMDLATALEILGPIEEALTYLHTDKDAGFAHLDVTPRNILIQETHHKGKTERRIVLTDLGLARVIDADGRAYPSIFGGAPGYWAPEQRSPTKDKPGTRSDIYSLGLVIGVMLTGRRAQEVLGILRGPNNTLPSTLPLEVKRVLQRATEEDPGNRYATVKGLVTAFTRAVEAIDQAETKADPSPQAEIWQARPKRSSLGSRKQSFQTELAQMIARTVSSWERGSERFFSLFSALGRRHTQQVQHSLLALAHTSLDDEEIAFVGETYTLQTGIAQQKPKGFRGLPFTITTHSAFEPITFDISCHVSDNIELLRHWQRGLVYDPRQPAGQFVIFHFKIIQPGKSSIAIDFYRERHLLQTIQLAFDARERTSLVAVSTKKG